MIRADAVSVVKGRSTLLDSASMVLCTGERLAVLGANGAGKSTLLSCLCGENTDYDGQVWLGADSLKELLPEQRAQRIAVMPQQVELVFPFRVWQVVAMGRSPWGDEQQTLEWQQEVMKATEVHHLQHRLYPQLSGGEKQRVQLARVLLQLWHYQYQSNGQQAYILLDECTSALDPAHQHEVMDLVSSMVGPAIGALAVMHDVALAASWADRVMLLRDGRVMAAGEASLLCDAEVLSACYDMSSALSRQYARVNQQWLESR
ncbi:MULTISPECIES: heme ABC transporter ATP-binding protein [unclassified Oceanobacter]|jgi:iron complex transport system ATP-binding protein|uniref:heme ABC transporter ATP-binding protein n=2 Tax=Gammaproteobacteria TaxID=1236 RepID=UPI0026E3D09F|nr:MULTISPECIES: heme ABC transporter ATP-binding protein [unclassified Oceanobacter]MDO6681206.1 heme ABC transporter ATP-binding protein [Oceanobacter sp. 5_MG-2023]MDP2608594.1 heme ABC transporter ATP-binding protein [Oceanobacter sp. 1_MG-2023]MDP2611644.1 heme ABC transporter ATP-binding protein [Oceanobacter sp. 2_MG-2023]